MSKDTLDVPLVNMTLRDYFAAKAVAVLLETDDCDREYIAVAKKCYAMADAMLEARKC